MADHSSDRPGRPSAAESRRTRPIETDAASLDAFEIPAPGAADEAVAPHDIDEPVASRPRSSRPARTDWRLGGRTTRRWREGLLAVALIALAVALATVTLLEVVWPSPQTALVSVVVLWVAFGGVAIYALVRSRPIGLLRFRAVDVLYAAGLALVLRIVQGWVETAEHGSAAFPSAPLVDGRPRLEWVLTDAVGAVLIAPVVEEFFFRAVILVTVYGLLRRRFGELAAGVAAVLASAGLFVLTHALLQDMDLTAAISVLLLGLVCAAFVVLTGRIWAAVLLHVGFNATYVVLVAVQTVFS